jgi:hypothetical protein
MIPKFDILLCELRESDDVVGAGAFESRLINLENNEYKIALFTSISATTGAVPIPTGATILTDELGTGSPSALLTQLQVDRPNFLEPHASNTSAVYCTSFNGSGNYVLNQAPQSWPIGIIYWIKIKGVDKVNVPTSSIIEESQTLEIPGLIRGNFLELPFITAPSLPLSGVRIYDISPGYLCIKTKDDSLIRFKLDSISNVDLYFPTNSGKLALESDPRFPLNHMVLSLNQNGTSTPTAIENFNNIGVNVDALSRSGVGKYTVRFTDELSDQDERVLIEPHNKLIYDNINLQWDLSVIGAQIDPHDRSLLYIETFKRNKSLETLVYSDNMLKDSVITIEIGPRV